MRFIACLLFCLVITGCAAENIGTVAKENNELDVVLQKSEMTSLVIKELQFITQNAMKDDDLDGALHAMEIAKDELFAIRKDLESISTQDKHILQLKRELEKNIIHLENAISLQLTGINNGDAKHFQEGYKQFKQFSKDLTEFNKKIKRS